VEEEYYKDAFGKIEAAKDEAGREYNVFVPNPLPPKIEFDQELVLILSKAEEKLGKLSGVGLSLQP